MKKHLLGLGIFSFIVVSFAVAFAFLCTPKIKKVEEIKKPVYELSRKTCQYDTKEEIANSLPKITQATISEKTRLFQATIEGGYLKKESEELKLHFFFSDGKETKFLITKNTEIEKNYVGDAVVWKVQFDSKEFKNLFGKKNNFYVISEVVKKNSNDVIEIPQFNYKKAVSILSIDDSQNRMKEKNLKETKILQ